MNRSFYIITGGPGVGKTTLLNSLEQAGYHIIPEDARRIIQEQMSLGGEGLPWKNKSYYTSLMLDASVTSYLKALQLYSRTVCFFDRGIPDVLCYARMEKLPLASEVQTMTERYTYHPKAFILPPWLDIYATDSERRQTWEEACLTFKEMKKVYRKCGYQIIEVPKDTVENRRNFVLQVIFS